MALSIVAILFVMMLPVFGQAVNRQTELARRTTCAANLRGVMNAMILYASSEAGNSFPMLPPPKDATTYDVTYKADEGTNNPDASVLSLYKNPKYTNNPSAGLWLLVLSEGMSPKVFNCPSDTFDNVLAKFATKAPADGSYLPLKADPGNYYLNFQSAKNISYSSAYPWTNADGKVTSGSWWRDLTDASQPILSDMAPYLGAKSEPATRPAGSDPKAALDAQWAVTRANSQNHQFDGQNVAFGDIHVDFDKTPAVGQKNDSIWGIRKSAEARPDDMTETPIEAGTLPHAPAGVPDLYDVVMVPTRDAKGDLK